MCDCPLCRLARWWLGDQIEEAPNPVRSVPAPITPALAQQYQSIQNAYAGLRPDYPQMQLGYQSVPNYGLNPYRG